MAKRRLPDPHDIITEINSFEDAEILVVDIKEYMRDLNRVIELEIDDTAADIEISERRQKMDSQLLLTGGNIAPKQSVVLADASASSLTLPLPSPLDVRGQVYHIKKININANDVVVDVTDASNIDRSATQTLTGSGRPSIMCYSDGIEYWII